VPARHPIRWSHGPRMKLDLVAPCKQCPFRRDVAGYLRPGRAEQILGSLVRKDESFICHKTIVMDHECQADEEEWDDTYRPILKDDKAQFCAGALILLKKLGHPNRIPRIAMHLGLWDQEKMRNEDVIFDTEEEMIQHMEKADVRDR
jgi:hypothetical protein